MLVVCEGLYSMLLRLMSQWRIQRRVQVYPPHFRLTNLKNLVISVYGRLWHLIRPTMTWHPTHAPLHPEILDPPLLSCVNELNSMILHCVNGFYSMLLVCEWVRYLEGIQNDKKIFQGGFPKWVRHPCPFDLLTTPGTCNTS